MAPREVDQCPHCGEPRALLTINEASHLARVDRKTIYRWMRKEMLEYCILPSGLLRIYRDSLIRSSGSRGGHLHLEAERAADDPRADHPEAEVPPPSATRPRPRPRST